MLGWIRKLCCGKPPKDLPIVYDHQASSVIAEEQAPVIVEEQPPIFSDDGYEEDLFRTTETSLSISDPYPVPPSTPHNFFEDPAWAALRVLRATVKLEKIVAANRDLERMKVTGDRRQGLDQNNCGTISWNVQADGANAMDEKGFVRRRCLETVGALSKTLKVFNLLRHRNFNKSQDAKEYSIN
ncbi:hypothetical protein BSKO_02621 [Bryopsis sp. KO-2023]|nr:hypothetical protein BSKO_02621 [Bryopsis sp. KO-2023]